MAGTFLTGALAGYGIAIPVGPVAVLIVQLGIRRGWPIAASAAAGAAAADFTFALLAASGGPAIARLIEPIETPFRYLSAVVLAVMAVSVYRSSRRESGRSDLEGISTDRRGVTFAKFLGLTIINPPTVIYFAAFVVGLGIADDLGPGEGAAFVAGAFLASLSWQLLLATVGAVAGIRLSPRLQSTSGVVGAIIVAAMAVLVVISAS